MIPTPCQYAGSSFWMLSYGAAPKLRKSHWLGTPKGQLVFMSTTTPAVGTNATDARLYTLYSLAAPMSMYIVVQSLKRKLVKVYIRV